MAIDDNIEKTGKELGNLGDEEEMAALSQMEPPRKRGGKKKIIILIAAVLIVGGGGFAAYHFLFASKKGKGPVSAPAQAKKTVPGPMLNLKPFLTNLADQDKTSYVKVDISLEFKPGTDPGNVKQLTSQIRNNIIMILSSKTSKEINSPEGMVSLRHEIARSLNVLLGAGTVTGVYFNNYLVQ